MTTLATLLPELGWLLPALLEAQVQAGTRAAEPGLERLGLADEHGLTRKGERVLEKLRDLADLLDYPLA